jgi:hypothetical protein
MRYPRGVRLSSLLLAFAPLALACVNTDAAVFVDPTITAPTATVTGGTLGATLKGGFTLALHLGPRATGPSEVSIGQFSILDAQQKASIFSPISIAATTNMFPAKVDLDSDVTIPLTFDAGMKTFNDDVKAKLCDPAGIVIGGTINDSLQDHSTPVASAVFHATGCM